MRDFEEWATSVSPQYGKLLIQMGATWNSFRREQNEVVEDLVAGGISQIAARDIVASAKEEIERSKKPMAVFWDLENAPIPSKRSGREVIERINEVLCPYGHITQFRGYASIGLNHIPEQKRSDLQQSGCHLVDCPHNGRKEVADKMIIVDAMEFAYTHLEGAALCFITNDNDYAYLLTRLRKPEWYTIVISKCDAESILHINANKKMNWNTEILTVMDKMTESILSDPKPTPPPGFHVAASIPIVTSNQEGQKPMDTPLTLPQKTLAGGNPHATYANIAGNTCFVESGCSETVMRSNQQLLREAVKNNSLGGAFPSTALKSVVSGQLRTRYQTKFTNTEAVQRFINIAIEHRFVIESGTGMYKFLTWKPDDRATASPLPTLVSVALPIQQSEIPLKAFEMGQSMPYALVLRSTACPMSILSKKKIYFTAAKKFTVVMRKNLAEMLNLIEDIPALKSGTLVDIRRVQFDTASVMCITCRTNSVKEQMILAATREQGFFCKNCYNWGDEELRAKAVENVVTAMEVLAENDDIVPREGIVRAMLFNAFSDCDSKQKGTLWIEEAVKKGKLVSLRRKSSKTTVNTVCLRRFWCEAEASYPEDDMDTTKEESFVVNLLWESNGCWITRKNAIQHLQNEFPTTMNTPYKRTKLFLNSFAKGLFFLGKGPFGHVVALTKEDAEAALNLAFSPKEDKNADSNV